MNIRSARMSDIPAAARCYEVAREYMTKSGNISQWGSSYPPEALIEDDIRNGRCFVGTGDSGEVHLVFAFIIGPDPTYEVIENGRWLNNDRYGTIHRIASDGTEHGTFSACLEFCKGLCGNIRADTHRDNLTMQHIFEKNGFVRCGIIHLADTSERIAYQIDGR